MSCYKKSTRLVITNAIYFNGNWVKQFDKNKTKQEEFRVSKNITVQVPMMQRTDKLTKFNYAQTEELQILEMLYEGEELSMLIILPKNEDLKSIEESLTVEKLTEWKNELREERVDVFIPKFTFKTKYSMKEYLKEMGMQLAFTPGAADFSGIDGTKNLFIDMIIHQAYVEVNEEGTEAAAATGVVIPVSMVPQFRADHPFIFLIQERETGNILFLGRVVNPNE
jgi:serpin B